MKNLIKPLFLSAIMILAAFSCDDDEDENHNHLIGTWKCIGFGSSETNELREIEPENCDECYILTFKTDGTFDGKIVMSVFSGKYEISESNKVTFSDIISTDIGEIGDAANYRDIYLNGTTYFKYNLIENQLKLYYSGSETEYLLYNLIN